MKSMDAGFINRTLAPPPDKICRAFEFFEISETKIVILGQDPYSSPGSATGLAFESGTNKINPSLKNIYLAAGDEINFVETAKQGVLWLNAALTGIQCTPAPTTNHIAMWRPFMRGLIREISKAAPGAYFVFWGSEAQEYINYLEGVLPDHILTYTHPSPLANNRLPLARQFAQCPHFKILNFINWTQKSLRVIEQIYPHFQSYRAATGSRVDYLDLGRDIGERIKYSTWLKANRKLDYKIVQMHTDGAASKNGKSGCQAYWAYIIHSGDTIIKQDFGAVTGDQSNNRGELQAILEGIRALPANYGAKIYTDSTYCVGVLSGSMNAHTNLDLIEEIKKYWFYVESIEHVRGHAGDRFNTLVDSLAAVEARKEQPD